MGYLTALLKSAWENKHAVMMCTLHRLPDGAPEMRHGRMNLGDYQTAVVMLAELLCMITMGTGVMVDKVLQELKEIHPIIAERYVRGNSDDVSSSDELQS